MMKNKVQLRLGEKIIPEAPVVKLSSGDFCVPQHYLTYDHTLESVESLICSIDYDPRYAVFAAQEENCIYIQVGVIGPDNYKSHTEGTELKLLFGRKWRVEPELPTSEIIQSVFLAIKKSREHEVRELFKLAINDSITTPFNTHIDLPLIAEVYYKSHQNSAFKAKLKPKLEPEKQVTDILSCISYDNCDFSLIEVTQRVNGLWLVDIKIEESPQACLPEVINRNLYLQVEDLSLNTLCRAVMNELVRLSDLHVDKNFSYKGFHRFDPDIDITEISHLSQQTRKIDLADNFAEELSKSNYLTDQMRIPPIKPGPLKVKYKDLLERFKIASE